MANKIISSEYTNKKMYYANFNITFGNDSEPMLEHFFDIIYPAIDVYKRQAMMRHKK